MLESQGSIEIIVWSLQVLPKASFPTYDNAAFNMPTGVESCIDPAPDPECGKLFWVPSTDQVEVNDKRVKISPVNEPRLC